MNNRILMDDIDKESHSLFLNIHCNLKYSTCRLKCITIIKNIYSKTHHTADDIDLGIQICDKFLSLHFINHPQSSENLNFLSYTAAVCVRLSMKVNNNHSNLNSPAFSGLNPNDLSVFERMLLTTISFDISPSNTPTYLCRSFMSTFSDQENKSKLIHTACSLILQFWEEKESILYAPSTIALAALTVAFIILDIPGESWLNTAADKYLASYKVGDPDSKMFSFDDCVQKIGDLFMMRRSSSPRNVLLSPVTVTQVHNTHLSSSPRHCQVERQLELDLIEIDQENSNDSLQVFKPILHRNTDDSVFNS